MKKSFLTFFLVTLLHFPVISQESGKPNPLDARSGLPVPKSLMDLRNLSVTLWIKFRRTSQHFYRYVNETAQFHAYAEVCKRHELNLSVGPITKLSHHYIQAVIPAHYDEPEFQILEALSKEEQQNFLNDIAGNIYNFEYGYRLASFNEELTKAGATRKAYCERVSEEYKLRYMALMTTARNRLPEFEATTID